MDGRVRHTYGPHDGGIHDALLPARLHHSSLQAGHNVTNMKLDDAVQLVGGAVQCTGCSCILAASWVLLNLSKAHRHDEALTLRCTPAVTRRQ